MRKLFLVPAIALFLFISVPSVFADCNSTPSECLDEPTCESAGHFWLIDPGMCFANCDEPGGLPFCFDQPSCTLNGGFWGTSPISYCYNSLDDMQLADSQTCSICESYGYDWTHIDDTPTYGCYADSSISCLGNESVCYKTDCVVTGMPEISGNEVNLIVASLGVAMTGIIGFLATSAPIFLLLSVSLIVFYFIKKWLNMRGFLNKRGFGEKISPSLYKDTGHSRPKYPKSNV